MALDVVVEGEESFTTGSTPVALKMTEMPKPPVAPSPPLGSEAASDSEQRRADKGQAGVIEIRTPAEAKALIDKVMRAGKSHAYWDPAHPNHAGAVAEMAKLHERVAGSEQAIERAIRNEPEPEQQEGEEGNPLDGLPDLRRFAGVPHPDLGGGRYDPADEYDFLTYVVEQNIPTGTARAMSEWYGTRIVTAGWQPLSQADKDDFRATFAGRLRPDQMETLIKWHDEELTPKLRKAQRG